MAGPLVYVVCDTSDIDPATNACAHVQYVQAPSLIPEFDAASGVSVSVAILTVWAIAYGIKSMKRVGD